MAKRYLVPLTEEERVHLLELTKKGKVSARKLTRAHSLLQADAGVSDKAIAAALHIGIATVERIRQRFVEEGRAAARGPTPTRWAAGSLPDRPGLQYPTRGTAVLDDAVVGRQTGGRPGGCGYLG